MPRAAFYAPMKPHDHPTPSGDRRMANLLIAALGEAGFSVNVVSRLRAWEGKGAPETQAAIRAAGAAEAAALIARWRTAPEASPDAWVSYHVYYRSPDWIGPVVARALAIPYVIVEASYARKRAVPVWRIAHDGALAAIRAADVVFCMTPHERPLLEIARGGSAGIIDFPAFVDAGPYRAAAAQRPRARARLCARMGGEDEAPVLLAVGMMRPGDKQASYARLAAALALLRDRRWRLAVAGDGPARGAVEELLRAACGDRAIFLGAVDADALAQLYAGADLLVWPGVGEAYGMVYLEAAAAGLPAVAETSPGVASVAIDGVGARLTPPGDARAYAAAVADLLDDADSRAALSRGAAASVAETRSVVAAAGRLRCALPGVFRP